MISNVTNAQFQSQQATPFEEDEAIRIFNRKDSFTSGLDDGRTFIVSDLGNRRWRTRSRARHP